MALRPFLIDLSDERCKYLFSHIEGNGFEVKEMTSQNIKDNPHCILIFPPHKYIEETMINKIGKDSLVFGGKVSDAALGFMAQNEISYINFLNDEEFLFDNAKPTAKGVIKHIIDNTDLDFESLRILVLGYGRIGKTLTAYLMALGAQTYIYTVDENEKAMSKIFTKGNNINSLDLSGFDVVVNTVPHKILFKSNLNEIQQSTVFIDVASGNYVDLEYLKDKDIRAIKAMGLPGKVAPYSAAMYMSRLIFDTLNSNTHFKQLYLVQK